jgi:ribosomal protein S12 methylthiotransferase accessory factor
VNRLSGSTVKGFTVGMHRVLAPSEMLARVAPLLPLAGVTRLANITGLDCVGIPTVSAVRPSAQTLSVASGKGLTLDAAKVSAAMEAIELFHAEVVQPPQIEVAHTEGRLAAALDQLPARPHAIIQSRLPVAWTMGHDLVHDEMVAVPVDLITLREPAEPWSPFHQSSNGLASGGVFVEALLMALLELVERDAVACHRLAARATWGELPRVRPETLQDMPLVQHLLGQLADADVGSGVYDCTVDTGIPVYLARLWNRSQRSVGVFFGSGAHLDPEIALLRALTEAAQSRVVYIAGTRDDVSGHAFAQVRAQDSPAVVASLDAQIASVDARTVRSRTYPTFEEDVRHIQQHLVERGIERLVVVELTLSEFRDHLSVVRVIAPGLAMPGVENGLGAARARAFACQPAA